MKSNIRHSIMQSEHKSEIAKQEKKKNINTHSSEQCWKDLGKLLFPSLKLHSLQPISPPPWHTSCTHPAHTI